MRYRAALLPDGGFPRGSPLSLQPAFGTKRNRAAHCGTTPPQNTSHNRGPETLLAQRPGPTNERMEVRRGN